jgi:preprotein translocase subunit SecG
MSEILPILLVIQVIISVSMITVILLQKSSSDGLSGLSGGSSGGNSLISGRASANLLTKTTAFLAVAFMANSLIMATITARSSSVAEKIIQDIESEEETVNSPIEEKKEIEEPKVPVSE